MAKSRAKQKSTSKQTKQGVATSSNAKKQVVSVLMFTLSLLLFIAAIVPGSGGWKAIHNFVLGSFGFFGYGVPVLIGVAAVYLALDRLHGKVLVKTVELSIFILLISCFVHIIGIAPDVESYSGAFAAAWDKGHASSGVLGALLG